MSTTSRKAPNRTKKPSARHTTRRRSSVSSPATPPAEPSTRTRPHGKYERLAYERQIRDLQLAYGDRWNDSDVYGDPTLTQHPKGFWFDIAAGERVVQFTEGYCRHHKGEWAGKPLILEDWQKFCQRVTYGWKKQDGTRRFQISYREVARKNGKTEQAGGEAAYLTVADNEPGAEVYSTATKEDQAKIVWSATAAMVKQSPALRKYLTVRTKTMFCDRIGSTFKPLGSDSTTLDGLNPSGHVCDEMHAHKKRGVWDVMITGMGARRQPMTIVITTAGVYDPESIGWELHTQAQQILDGVLEDDTMFCIIFAPDDGDDPKDPNTWWKANPNLGVSVKWSYLEDQAGRAFRSPAALNTFLRLHVNVWTQQVTKWISIEDWNACAVIPANTTMSAYKGKRAFLAADLSTKLDITALAVIFPQPEGCYDAFFKFYVPAATVLKRAQDRKLPDYAAWVRDGWLTETPGATIDYDFLRRDILELDETLVISQFAYDPWNASQFSNDMQKEGFSLDPEAEKRQLVEMRQGMATLSEPSKEFERLIVDKKFRHNGHPVMRWMVDNTVVRKDANGNIAPDKKTAIGKIDGVVACIMALRPAILRPVLVDSVYKTRGVRVLTST
jgi:phage terminase large subunit-like protein